MTLTLDEGTTVYVLDKAYTLRKIIDHDKVLAIELDTGHPKVLKIAHLASRPTSSDNNIHVDLSQIPNDKLEEAERRLQAIEPLLHQSSRTAVEARATEVGVSTATLYNWLKAYRSTGLLSSLVKRPGQGGAGKSRLLGEQEAIINDVIETHYLTHLKPNTQKTYEEISLKCFRAEVPIPSLSSIRRRLKQIDEKRALAKREGKKAIHKFMPLENGPYPDIVKPMHTIQIDHTKVDIMLVDDIYRVELGRPYITLAIDVFSRMVAGYYISFEVPGYMATGMAIANAVLRKDAIIEKYNLNTQWPVYGKPQFIHVDNAGEFRGIDIQRICKEYGINLMWRPVGRPHFGGHIERLFGTLNQDIHTLAGTTFSNIHKRGEYNSQKEAVMTLGEFEKWLAILIVDKYHNTKHTAIGMTPLEKYNEGIFGSINQPPKGFPAIIEDEFRFRVNMLPSEERTIQRYGIKIDDVVYYDRVLEQWIGAKEPGSNPPVKRKFTIRMDPRDISKVYFYEPSSKEYYEIPYRNLNFPAVSMWEWKAAKRHLQSQENREHNQYEIFDALQRMREIAIDAKSKTKTHRRSMQRRATLVDPAMSLNELRERRQIDEMDEFELDGEFDDIQPFEGIED